jgi:hypothetical protein
VPVSQYGSGRKIEAGIHWMFKRSVSGLGVNLAGCSDPQCISVVPESVRIPVVTYFLIGEVSVPPELPHDCFFRGFGGGGE